MGRQRKTSGREGPSFEFHSGRFPGSAGCYLMKNASGEVIYVGKAVNLRRRLASYFQAHPKDRRTRRLAPRIRDIEVILVNTENESLILEDNLIKYHRPRYNSMRTRQDLGYPLMVLTGEPLPRLLPYRRNWHNKQWEQTEGKGQGIKFGPYLSKTFRDTVMNFAIETYGLRICHDLPQKVCLRYQLHKCSGICEQKLSPEEYARDVERAVNLLSHRITGVLEQMRCRMWEYARNAEFERAGKLRDQIRVLSRVLERQIVDRDVKHDQDVVYFGENGVSVIRIHMGMLRLCRLHEFWRPARGVEDREQFLLSQYGTDCPDEIITNAVCNHKDVERALSEKHEHPVEITMPRRGVKHELLKLCKKNHEYRDALTVSPPRL